MLLLVRFIAELSIDVNGERQSDVAVVWINQSVTDTVDVVDIEFIAPAPCAGPDYSGTKSKFHATVPEGRFEGGADPESPGPAETETVITPEVPCVETLIESAIAVSGAGSPVIAVKLLVARVPLLVLLLAVIGISLRRVPVGIALIAIGIALVTIGIMLLIALVAISIVPSIVGLRIVCVRRILMILPRG